MWWRDRNRGRSFLFYSLILFLKIYVKNGLCMISRFQKSNLKDMYIVTLLSQCLHKRKGLSKVDLGQVRYSWGGDHHHKGSGTDLGCNHLHSSQSPLQLPYLRSNCVIQRHRTFVLSNVRFGFKRESRR